MKTKNQMNLQNKHQTTVLIMMFAYLLRAMNFLPDVGKTGSEPTTSVINESPLFYVRKFKNHIYKFLKNMIFFEQYVIKDVPYKHAKI